MARFQHSELTERIHSLTARYIAAEFPFSDDVMRASLFAIGLRGDEFREAMQSAIEQKAAAKCRLHGHQSAAPPSNARSTRRLTEQPHD